jgi:hypothetical protein
MKHKWNGPYLCSEEGANALERNMFKCDRCGTSVICRAFGEISVRVDLKIRPNRPTTLDELVEDPYPPRKLNGWETPDGAAVRAKIPLDCDVVIAQRVMES